jgi:hypothetical protein
MMPTTEIRDWAFRIVMRDAGEPSTSTINVIVFKVTKWVLDT